MFLNATHFISLVVCFVNMKDKMTWLPECFVPWEEIILFFSPLWHIDYSLIQQNKGLINLHGSMKNKLAQFKVGLIQYYKLEEMFHTLSPFTSPNIISREWHWKTEFSLHDISYSGSFFKIQSLEILIAFPKPHLKYFQTQKQNHFLKVL